MNAFHDTMARYQCRVETKLQNAISERKNTPPLLRDAIHYAVTAGGKRLRPILVYAIGECFSVANDLLDNAAAAIECIHCYSLIHDDLPAMDDDKLRRGKPTCHIVFGEAMAILAGDALQTLSFELLSSQKHGVLSTSQLKMIEVLAQHAGFAGMIGGQSLDLLAEGQSITAEKIEQIHELKTAALIRASVAFGAIAANRDTSTCNALDKFALQFGLAFQLQDDFLDVFGNNKKLGKETGQDIKQHKASYAVLFGAERTRARVGELIESAKRMLKDLPGDVGFLTELCDAMMVRDK